VSDKKDVATPECPEHGDSCEGEECCCRDKHPRTAKPSADWIDRAAREAAQEIVGDVFGEQCPSVAKNFAAIIRAAIERSQQ
jgi:hypothetical protein